ncbi:hypothetical protein [Salinicola sp. CPA57]|uniref:hypothetical protein n=1 Tax=Salinicola sp. CPA57 TaxID=1949080 RepID=UPI000DA16858|nr:hypothetical protein [Salinicola sp. CPA57]
MEIETGSALGFNGKAPVHVNITESNESDPNQSVEVRVWVDDVDSRSQLYASAEEAALPVLKAAVAALEKKLSK